MSKRRVLAFGIAAAVTVGVVALAAPPTTKTITLECGRGWKAGGGGVYGGVPFNVTCKYGRGSTRISDPVGTAYSVRIGVESDSIGADCAFSGDAETAEHSCAEVLLTIR
jgi:hypothetical protein